MTTTGATMRTPRISRPVRAARPPARGVSDSAAAATASGGTSGATERPGLTFRVPLDELSRYAGLTAFVMAVMGGAGILATVAYLAAWNVPAPMLRLDPLTAALRSEVVLYQLIMLAVVVFGLAAVSRRFAGRRWAGRIGIGALLALIAFLGLDALRGGFLGPVIALAAGVLIFGAHGRGWVGDRTVAILLVLIALGSAAQTGYEMGIGYRDGAAARTGLVLTTTAPVSGLEGTVVDDAAWRYDGLYLVFRDGEAVYVSRPGVGSRVWVVPAGRVAAVELTGTDR